ncbi:MAG: hypothetical protein ACLTYN_03600 [Dysosmobacter welbionis]
MVDCDLAFEHSEVWATVSTLWRASRILWPAATSPCRRLEPSSETSRRPPVRSW